MDVHEQLREILRGASPRWPYGDDPAAHERFLGACRDEGVVPLVWQALCGTAIADAWPDSVTSALEHEARLHVAWELIRQRELVALLGRFAGARIDVLLLKGTPLAYTEYADPSLRTRSDTDVFVRDDDRIAATRIVEDAGYARVEGVEGELVSYQQAFIRRDDRGIDHIVDLHWRINNGQVFARALSFDDAYADSVPVPALGTHARTLSRPHALLLGAMHRAAHLGVEGPSSERLLWIVDIDLLARNMQSDDWRRLVALAHSTGMRAVTRDALARAHAMLDTAVPHDVMASLGAAGGTELSAAYLEGGRRRVLLTDWRALPGWPERLSWLRESLFPAPRYVLAKYGSERRWLLPWWYARRVVEGAIKLMGR